MKVEVFTPRRLVEIDLVPGMQVFLKTKNGVKTAEIVRVVQVPCDVYCVFDNGTWRTTKTYNETWWKL